MTPEDTTPQEPPEERTPEEREAYRKHLERMRAIAEGKIPASPMRIALARAIIETQDDAE